MRDPMKCLERDPYVKRAMEARDAVAKLKPGEAEALLTVKEMADLLRVSTAMVYRLVRQGELKAIHIGRLVRFRPDAYQRLIEGNPKPPWE